MNRRVLLGAAALAPLAALGPAFGQVGWPDRVLRIVVPFVPGSFTDVSARLLANELTEQLGQPVVIENRGGAGGTAGTVAVVRAAPDGYTLLLTDTSLSISPGLYPNLPYDPVARSGADQPDRALAFDPAGASGARAAHAHGARGAREAEAG
jgi:tripartite-type tricarboxylate transporter receptor subunit TctC